MNRTSIVTLTFLLATSLAPAQLHVTIPAGTTNSAGDSATTSPWGTAAVGWAGLRDMTIYGASNFTGQSITTPILIHSIRWRTDEAAPGVNGGMFSRATVELSTAPVGWASATTNFAANHGSDRTVAYDTRSSQPVFHTSGVGPTSWTPSGSWAIDLGFARPFFYDPAAGDLVVDVDYPAGSFLGSGRVGPMDAQATNSNSTQVIARSSYPLANGVVPNHAPVVEITYLPVVGLHASFTADVTRGASPLTVQFSDASFSTNTPNNQPTGWRWDFDGDGVVDSTVQHPTHQFANCGSYDVSLTALDGAFAASTITRPSFIDVDGVEANFTELLIAPLTIQFLDTTVGSPTTWDWDLDGDGTTDSTVQNPVFTYGSVMPVDVALTSSRGCGPPDTATHRVRPEFCLETTFAGNDGVLSGGTVFFDLEVSNRNGVTIDSLELNLGGSAFRPFAIDCFACSESATGNEQSPDAWTQMGTANGVSMGQDERTRATLAAPVHLARGTYGIAIHYRSGLPRFTDGAGSNPVFANGHLALTPGFARATTVGNPFNSGSSNLPSRVWNGALCYTTCSFDSESAYGFAGQGCAGSLGKPELAAHAAPTLGTTLTVDVNRLPANAAIMLTGLSNTNSALGPLPISGTPFGAPGCELRVSPDANLLLLGTGNTATWQLQIPNDPALVCVQFFQQALVADPGFNLAGIVLSDAAGFVTGL